VDDVFRFLVRYGYAVLFVWVAVEQIGFPLPAIPLLLAAGALAGVGKLNIGLIIGTVVLASLISDTAWYEVGRRKGMKVLNLLCRMSLEPDSCVRRTEDVFARHGARSLLVAKFVPGLTTAAPPLAGIFRMRRSRFLVFDGVGAALWAGVFAGLGLLFSDELERLAGQAARLGTWLAAISWRPDAYILWKYVNRQRFLRRLRVARITADELKGKLDAGEDVMIVDLRHSMDFEAEPHVIPGALRLSAEDLDGRHHEIPRDRDIILYCT
jgi:membrane protein DedA with SNARE-associated domain